MDSDQANKNSRKDQIKEKSMKSSEKDLENYKRER